MHVRTLLIVRHLANQRFASSRRGFCFHRLTISLATCFRTFVRFFSGFGADGMSFRILRLSVKEVSELLRRKNFPESLILTFEGEWLAVVVNIIVLHARAILTNISNKLLAYSVGDINNLQNNSLHNYRPFAHLLLP